MNPTHIHLVITHLPIFGSFLGILVLIYGLIVKSSQVKMAAYMIFVISAAGAVIAFKTGESAEDTAEHVLNLSHKVIHEHEDAAGFAVWSMAALGVLSIVSGFFSYKNSPLTGKLALGTLALALFSFSTVARTGYLGGKIRHTEINELNSAIAPTGEHDD